MHSQICSFVALSLVALGLLSHPPAAGAEEGSAAAPLALSSADFTLAGPQGLDTTAPFDENGRQNSEPWSAIWFKGQLYVGTARSFTCYRTLVVRIINPFEPYPPTDLDVYCPAERDLQLRGEIWRWTPGSNSWDRVYRAPEDVPHPKFADRFLARDIGYRTMAIFREADGTEALYVGGVTARSLYKQPDKVPPPRILRTTDGVNWQAVPQNSGLMATTPSVGFRSMVVHNDRLYVVASSGLNGQGQVYEATNPAGGDDSFRRITPLDWDADPRDATEVYELSSYNGFLYMGSGAQQVSLQPRPFKIWKTTAAGEPPYQLTEVIQNAGDAPLGKRSFNVVSMTVFDNHLYIGTSVPAEIYRINPDDSWELIVGNARRSGGVLKEPLSGLPPGFGWEQNLLIWRMECHNGELFVGTLDQATENRTGPQPPPEHIMGFDLYSTADGVNFQQITNNGFDGGPAVIRKFNVGVRTLTSTPSGLFVGAANQFYGLTMWQERLPAAAPGAVRIYLPLLTQPGVAALAATCTPATRG